MLHFPAKTNLKFKKNPHIGISQDLNTQEYINIFSNLNFHEVQNYNKHNICTLNIERRFFSITITTS